MRTLPPRPPAPARGLTAAPFCLVGVRRAARHALLLALPAGCLLTLLLAGPGEGAIRVRRSKPKATPDRPAAVSPAEAKNSWAEGLAAGKRLAREQSRPLLVRVGGAGCPWCEKLDKEIEQADVQQALARWSLAYVDLDAAPTDARQLAVGPIPALRVVGRSGRVVAHDGYLPADELVAWLKESFETATAAPSDVLAEEGPPDAEAVAELVGEFRSSEAARRETAIRRLLRYPHLAAPGVVEALGQRKLSVRLAALELLNEWHAPVAELDPWQPDSFTAERDAALRQWAQAQQSAREPEEFSDEKRLAAERELDRLARADDAAAAAMIERLARLGPALLPIATARWREADSDQVRQRLLHLRYRLVASDSLVLRWPGGLERLAAPQAAVRHAAAEELVSQAGPGDDQLLVELFGDSDPLVREISLRGLQHVGGAQAAQALVKLLDDPEPNLRAAVLKQLAEQPAAELVGKVSAYAVAEADADLVVHAIRFLKTTPSDEALKALTQLLKHESWQVRAEAAEALGELAHKDQGGAAAKADSLVALIELLDDSDAFVVSRAMQALKAANVPSALEPLLAAAEQHPEMAAEVLQMVASQGDLRAKARPQMLKFTKHADPRVRTAAVQALAEMAGGDASEVLLAALDDSASEVRSGAARSLFTQAQAAMQQDLVNNNGRQTLQVRPQPSLLGSVVASIFGKKKEKPPEPEIPKSPAEFAEQWLAAYQGGRGRPEWMTGAIEPLQKMLAADEAGERLAAALALVPLGQSETALPVLSEVARTSPAERAGVAEVLPWLAWDARRRLFDELLALDPGQESLLTVFRSFVLIKDPRAAESLWKMADRDELPPELFSSLYFALNELYEQSSVFGHAMPADTSIFLHESLPDESVSLEGPDPELARSSEKAAVDAPEKAAVDAPEKPEADVPAPEAAQALDETSADEAVMVDDPFESVAVETASGELVDLLSQYAREGRRGRRTLALALLLSKASGQVKELAAPIVDDEQAPPEFRADALQIWLLSLPQDEAEETAARFVTHSLPRLRKLALERLVLGPQAITLLHESIYLSTNFYRSYDGGGKAIEVSPPKGLKLEDVRPLLDDPDPETAACAAYLVAVLGDPAGLAKLVAHWRKQEAPAALWRTPVFRAISALDDDAQTPVLAEIYATLEPYEARELYWTIRSMHGAEVIKLRKRIRNDVGMDNLR